MNIIYVPIEKIPTRYTADWISQFEKEFETSDVNYRTIEGFTTNEIPIEEGSVLDVFTTNQYKLSQLTQLLDMVATNQIEDDDIIFFADLWFPGIESLFYVRDITKKQFKIAGVFHAGTWDPYDFTCRNGMRDWAQHVELGWLHGVDLVFVATQFHKDLIVMNNGEFDPDKIFVTGIPFYSKELQEKYPITEKENIVVFPHRCEIEKHPEKFDRLMKKYPKWKFVKTLEETSNRDEYFKLLAKSKVMVSFADQETFGYSTVEAMALGNYVIVPNKLSYRETVPPEYRYKPNKDKEVEKLLEDFMSREELPNYNGCLDKWSNSIQNMLKVLRFDLAKTVKAREEQAKLEQEEFERINKEREEKRLQRELAKQQKAKENSQTSESAEK